MEIKRLDCYRDFFCMFAKHVVNGTWSTLNITQKVHRDRNSSHSLLSFHSFAFWDYYCLTTNFKTSSVLSFNLKHLQAFLVSLLWKYQPNQQHSLGIIFLMLTLKFKYFVHLLNSIFLYWEKKYKIQKCGNYMFR